MGDTAVLDGRGPGEVYAHGQLEQSLEMPFGWFPQPVYFATIARRHMHDFAHDRRGPRGGRGRLSPPRHSHPGAVMHDRPLTMAAYPATPLIADPFRREDCCLISDGGGAYVDDHPGAGRRPAGAGRGGGRCGAEVGVYGGYTGPQGEHARAAPAMMAVGPAGTGPARMGPDFPLPDTTWAPTMPFWLAGGRRAAPGDPPL